MQLPMAEALGCLALMSSDRTTRQTQCELAIIEVPLVRNILEGCRPRKQTQSCACHARTNDEGSIYIGASAQSVDVPDPFLFERRTCIDRRADEVGLFLTCVWTGVQSREHVRHFWQIGSV